MFEALCIALAVAFLMLLLNALDVPVTRERDRSDDKRGGK